MKRKGVFILFILVNVFNGLHAQSTDDELFSVLDQLPWKQTFSDSGTAGWEEHWALDGQRAVLKNDDSGMLFCAGPVAYDDGSHAVLWTRKQFSGPMKLTFEYTRMDDIAQFVNIIYIQATGIGASPYYKDISQWDSLRLIPTMSTYFRNMNTYHISFAAFDVENDDPANDYVRARRYPVAEGGNFGKDTALEPDYTRTGLFKPGIRYMVTVIKKGDDLIMRVAGDNKMAVFKWNTSSFLPIEEGRVGLRHMYTRCARYANIRMYGLD